MLRSAPKERVSKHGDQTASFETPPSAAPQDEDLQLAGAQKRADLPNGRRIQAYSSR
jgi:hypothetical protein